MSNATGDAAIAVEKALSNSDRARILDKFRHTNLNGAEVADILDILDDHDALLPLREPFHEGAEDAVRVALGWPTSGEDDDQMRGAVLRMSALAIALLTNAMPTPGAVIRLTQSAWSKR